MGKRETCLIAISIGATIGAIILSIIKRNYIVIGIIVTCLVIGSVVYVIGSESTDECVQYMPQEDEEKTCTDGYCSI